MTILFPLCPCVGHTVWCVGLPTSHTRPRTRDQSSCAATDAGIPGHDHEITDWSPAGAAARLDRADQTREQRAGVVAIPHQAFCDDESVGAPYVRWAFCKQPSVLREALDRLDRGLR